MKRILVGLDGSPREAEVLDAARTLADKIGAELILFRAVSLPTELPPRALAVPPASLGELLVDDARQHLTALAARLPPSVHPRVRVDLGAPWAAIRDAARIENADLIAIGSHGYGGIDRLLGTTAAKVVNHADRSVLVIRSTKPV